MRQSVCLVLFVPSFVEFLNICFAQGGASRSTWKKKESIAFIVDGSVFLESGPSSSAVLSGGTVHFNSPDQFADSRKAEKPGNLRGAKQKVHWRDTVSVSLFFAVAGAVWLYVATCTSYFHRVPVTALRPDAPKRGGRRVISVED